MNYSVRANNQDDDMYNDRLRVDQEGYICPCQCKGCQHLESSEWICENNKVV